MIFFLFISVQKHILHIRCPEKDHANQKCNNRMNRRKADFKFAYKFLEDDV